jgi:hypothetical protein
MTINEKKIGADKVGKCEQDVGRAIWNNQEGGYTEFLRRCAGVG